MSKPRRKSQNQAHNDWVRRRQNIARGMRIALYEINQKLAPLGISASFPPGFIDRTVALAEGGRVNATVSDQHSAFMYELEDQLRGRGFVVARL